PILGSLVKYYSDPEFHHVRRFWALSESIDTLAHAACVAILGVSSLAAALICVPETPRQYSYQTIENPVVKPEFFSDSGSANTKASESIQTKRITPRKARTKPFQSP
ncbi:MAG: hypothetical protein ACKO5E_12845, partial [bacterium]